jgi:hypothetical protein
MSWALVVVTISFIIFLFSILLTIRHKAKFPLRQAPLRLAFANIGILITVLTYAQFFSDGIFVTGGIKRSTWTVFYIVYSALLPAGFAKEWVKDTKAVLLTIVGNMLAIYSFALSIIGYDIYQQYGNILICVLGIIITCFGLLYQWRKA